MTGFAKGKRSRVTRTRGERVRMSRCGGGRTYEGA